ncbi:response regulator [Azorhizobium caulinodans]|nr:response regulator [Azorhizobium caulinodans]
MHANQRFCPEPGTESVCAETMDLSLATCDLMGMMPTRPHASPFMGGARVIETSPLLIVDDEPEYLDEILEALAFEGVSAISASNGIDAVQTLRRCPDIRLVVTDIRMPDMDGIALMEAARQEFSDRDLQFIVVTGHAAKADIERAKAAGVIDCLTKPLSMDALQRALKALPV